MFDARKLLEQVLGGGSGGAGGFSRPGESLTDTAKRYLGEGSKKAGLEGQGGGLAVGALAGSALGLLLGSKKARGILGDLGGTAVKVGGMALVAGLAYKAWTSYQQKNGGPAAPAPMPGTDPRVLPPPADSPFNIDAAPEGSGTRAEQVLIAMISAAKADGHIDADEQRLIFERLDDLSLDAEAKAFVMDELRAPLDIERVVRQANNPAAAAEIYAASLLAMDPDSPAERGYLDMLAARLGIDRGLALEIERSAAAALGR